MDLKGIIAIAGKPGLYKVIAQGRANIIVQSLENDKKFPAFASDKISALDDISIYTYDKDVPLTEVYTTLAEKENFAKSIDHKEEPKKLREYLVTFLPNYDAERVYDTDVKKLFQWYNLLIEKGLITKERLEEFRKAQAEAETKAVEKEKPAKPVREAGVKAAAEPKPEKKAATPKAKTSEEKAEKAPAKEAKKTAAKTKEAGKAADKAAKPVRQASGKTTKK